MFKVIPPSSRFVCFFHFLQLQVKKNTKKPSTCHQFPLAIGVFSENGRILAAINNAPVLCGIRSCWMTQGEPSHEGGASKRLWKIRLSQEKRGKQTRWEFGNIEELLEKGGSRHGG